MLADLYHQNKARTTILKLNIMAMYSETCFNLTCLGREVLYQNRQDVKLHSVKHLQKRSKGYEKQMSDNTGITQMSD